LVFEAEIDLTYMGGIERGKRNPSFAGNGKNCRGVGSALAEVIERVPMKLRAGASRVRSALLLGLARHALDYRPAMSRSGCAVFLQGYIAEIFCVFAKSEFATIVQCLVATIRAGTYGFVIPRQRGYGETSLWKRCVR
jgi:hypothetical protein